MLSDSGFDLLNKLLTYDPEKVDNELCKKKSCFALVEFFSDLIRPIVFPFFTEDNC